MLSIDHYKADPNRRSRENYFYILQSIISVLHIHKLSIQQLKAYVDTAFPFIYYQNVYVRKLKVVNLQTILSLYPKIENKTSKSTDPEPEAVSTSRIDEIIQVANKYKTQVSRRVANIKKQTRDIKEIKHKTIEDLNVLLAISYS